MHRCEVTSYYQYNYKYLTLAICKHIIVCVLGRATVADAGQTPRNAVCPPQHGAPPSRDVATCRVSPASSLDVRLTGMVEDGLDGEHGDGRGRTPAFTLRRRGWFSSGRSFFYRVRVVGWMLAIRRWAYNKTPTLQKNAREQEQHSLSRFEANSGVTRILPMARLRSALSITGFSPHTLLVRLVGGIP